MQDDGVLTRIEQVLIERLAREVPGAEVDLFHSGVLDSLGFADLLVGVEEEFGICIPVAEIDFERFRTLGALCNVVRETIAASAVRARAA